MSTKNISRTIIEGGRRVGNRDERYLSNTKVRAKNQVFKHDAKNLVDSEELGPAPKRQPIRKEFADKLGPAYRWLRTNVGRNWNETYARLIKKFDTRTVAGRHIVFDHMLQDITMQGKEVPGRYRVNSFFVDDDGILRLSEENRWNRYGRVRYKGVPGRQRLEWADNRRVMDYGVSMFWMIATERSWKQCLTYQCPNKHLEMEALVPVGPLEMNALLTFQKKSLLMKVVNGETLYYRRRIKQICKQNVGTYRQGARFSKEDHEMWAKLNQYEKDELLWVKGYVK